MRLFLLLLFFTGLILVGLNEILHPPPPVVEVRYYPRDLDTYLREEPQASVLFKDVFESPGVQVP